MTGQGRIVAVLGPTNTGKTHYAIERMLGYRSGIIGLPLRLLAREVYERIVRARGPSVVALITGEERIVPERVQYWVCTVEAMPEGMGADFVAVDEIQLCADPERGHVFTDRLLKARGLHETLFLGSDTMRGPIRALVEGVTFVTRERMSQLSYAGPRKISRMKPRSAIVGFSVDNVYAIAELLRRQRGGAAVVMGALSPRTRNAQVAMYQAGEVDFLVATDAIGMGLNLDIDHVAFSALVKFDGRRLRTLAPNELAQIAGRAGRGMSDGTFGVTGEAPDLPAEVSEAITGHNFTPVRKLQWRNSALSFGMLDALIRSLEESPENPLFLKARAADDVRALKTLAEEAEIRARASDAASVRLLWDVCRIPDFRGISHGEHARLLGRIFAYLHENGRISEDWFAGQVQRINRTDGDIDTLSKRLAFIRTWTYVAQRKGWLNDEEHWRGETRAIEDRLSDALHGALTQRFVDRRTSVLLRRLKQKEAMVAEVNDKGEVTVEGHVVGRLEGFRFAIDKSASGQEAKTLKQAGIQALRPHFSLRADRFYNAPDTEIDFTEQGGLMWGEHAVGKLAAGDDALKPKVQAFVDEEAGEEVIGKVTRRLQHFIDRKIATLFEPLLNMSRDEELQGLARGFAFRLAEGFGIVSRDAVADDVRALDQEARGGLRKHGVRFGQYTIFMPLLLKPAPTRLRLVLWSLSKGLDTFPEAPPPGLVTVPAMNDAEAGADLMSGYRNAGERAIRIDMLERLADMLRGENSRAGFEATPDMLSITGMTLEQFAGLMEGLGYHAEKGERAKLRKPDGAAQETDAPAGPEAETGDEKDSSRAEPEPVAAKPDEAAPDIEPAAEAGGPEETGPEETGPDESVPDESVPDESGREGAKPEETADSEPAHVPDASDAATPDADAVPETEIFYIFTWAGHRGRGKARGEGRNDRSGKAAGKPGGKARRDQGKPKQGQSKGRAKGARRFESKPAKKDQIDPDNPFAAALMGLRDKG